MLSRTLAALLTLLQDASVDLRVANPTARSPHRREVVLPDGVHNLRGFVKPPTADVMAAFKEGGRFSKFKSGLYLSWGRAWTLS
jgi:hypothetical protein